MSFPYGVTAAGISGTVTNLEYTSSGLAGSFSATLGILQEQLASASPDGAAVAAQLTYLRELLKNGQTENGNKKHVTSLMASVIETLFRSFQLVGVAIDDSNSISVSSAQIQSWKELSILSPEVQQVLSYGDTITNRNRSLQSMLEADYVKAGNDVLSQNLSNLESALRTTKNALDALGNLQQMHNYLTVDSKPPFVFDSTGLTAANYAAAYRAAASAYFNEPLVPSLSPELTGGVDKLTIPQTGGPYYVIPPNIASNLSTFEALVNYQPEDDAASGTNSTTPVDYNTSGGIDYGNGIVMSDNQIFPMTQSQLAFTNFFSNATGQVAPGVTGPLILGAGFGSNTAIAEANGTLNSVNSGYPNALINVQSGVVYASYSGRQLFPGVGTILESATKELAFPPGIPSSVDVIPANVAYSPSFLAAYGFQQTTATLTIKHITTASNEPNYLVQHTENYTVTVYYRDHSATGINSTANFAADLALYGAANKNGSEVVNLTNKYKAWNVPPSEEPFFDTDILSLGSNVKKLTGSGEVAIDYGVRAAGQFTVTDWASSLNSIPALGSAIRKLVRLRETISAQLQALSAITPRVNTSSANPLGEEDANALIGRLRVVYNNLQSAFQRTGGGSVTLTTPTSDAFSGFSKWLLDNYTVTSGPDANKAGLFQQNITYAITAGQNLNDQQKEEVRRFLFVFEEYYKSASSILTKLTDLISRIAQTISRG